MAEVRPFRGVRYDIAKVGALSDVVAPPYDVIAPALQDELYRRSPYNSIRLELTRDEAGEAPDAKYVRAAETLKGWRREGVLVEEPHPALYVYEQTFEAEGQTFVRTGFFARVRLERFGEGKIYPHEQTLSGPKADRLNLYRATGYNLSPVFGLYPDPENAALRAAREGIADRTPLESVDHNGVINRLWPVHDQRAHTIVQGLMAEHPVFIADGHHRYETGVAYRDELAAQGKLSGEDDPANFILMMLVSMSDPGLQILPTHRLINGLEGITAEQVIERLSPHFEVQRVADIDAAWDFIQEGGDQDRLAFGTRADGAWLTARLISDEAMDKLAADQSPEWRSLGVSILHVLVAGELLKGLGTPSFRYVHTLDEVRDDRNAAGGYDLAALVPPAGMDHVAAIASQLEKMPPKSTYFYPKLLTGLVLNPLR